MSSCKQQALAKHIPSIRSNGENQAVTHKMIDQSDEEVEEQRRPAGLHLHLHGAAALEGVAAADDERKVVRAQLGVAGGRVGVGKAGGGEDGTALNT